MQGWRGFPPGGARVPSRGSGEALLECAKHPAAAVCGSAEAGQMSPAAQHVVRSVGLLRECDTETADPGHHLALAMHRERRRLSLTLEGNLGQVRVDGCPFLIECSLVLVAIDALCQPALLAERGVARKDLPGRQPQVAP